MCMVLKGCRTEALAVYRDSKIEGGVSGQPAKTEWRNYK